MKSHLKGEKTDTIGKIVIGTVFGDLHDIGKNLVASMFEGCGFEVVNMGVNISADKFVETVKIEKTGYSLPFCPIDDDNELYESRHGCFRERRAS